MASDFETAFRLMREFDLRLEEALGVVYVALAVVIALQTLFPGQLERLLPGTPGRPAERLNLARAQLLLVTLVVGGLYLTLSIDAGSLVELPASVLVLYGLSLGGYLVSTVFDAQRDAAALALVKAQAQAKAPAAATARTCVGQEPPPSLPPPDNAGAAAAPDTAPATTQR